MNSLSKLHLALQEAACGLMLKIDYFLMSIREKYTI
jgi:hypothetical protein